MCNICRTKRKMDMKKFFNTLCLAAVLMSAASCKFDTQSTQSISFGFDKAEAVMMGYVEPTVPESGVYWLLHLYSGGVQTAYLTLVSKEGEDSFLPTGTFKCSTSKSPEVGTFIQGSVDKEGAPQYSYVITDSDDRYTYYSLLTDGTVGISKDKDDYIVSASLFSYTTVVSLSFKGEVKYANEEEETEE